MERNEKLIKVCTETNGSYFYNLDEEYKVIEGSEIAWKVAEGEHQGKLIAKGHCKVIQKDYHVTDEEMDILMKKYGLRYRTATEFGAFDERTKKWILKMMELAYVKGKTGKGQLEQ